MSKVDYLSEDTLIPNDQKFLCISFLSDHENKKTLCGIKVRGCFETYEKACEHAKKLQNIDPYFNVFVGESGKWLAYDPDPESKYIKDSEYANEELNNIMKGYLENQEKAKIFHEQRKNELVRQNVLDNISTISDNINDLQNKINQKDITDEEKSKLKNNIETYEEQINKMNIKKKELEEQLELTTEQLKIFHKKNMKPSKIIET